MMRGAGSHVEPNVLVQKIVFCFVMSCDLHLSGFQHRELTELVKLLHILSLSIPSHVAMITGGMQDMVEVEQSLDTYHFI